MCLYPHKRTIHVDSHEPVVMYKDTLLST